MKDQKPVLHIGQLFLSACSDEKSFSNTGSKINKKNAELRYKFINMKYDRFLPSNFDFVFEGIG
jgi:hypothetical protein